MPSEDIDGHERKYPPYSRRPHILAVKGKLQGIPLVLSLKRIVAKEMSAQET
jgi:hypothetical protein